MATLELKRVDKAFGETKIIHGVDLAVADGEFVVFVGPSGCGKSTLLRLIAGLETATAGDILHRRPARQRRRGRGARLRDGVPVLRALPAHDASARTWRSGCENMGTAARRDRSQGRRRRRRCCASTSCCERKPTQLSGGQRQRVAIGRAIVREPKLFLFDEPLSNLDAELRVSMRAEIRACTRGSATMIYVTHDQVEAMTMADKIVVLRAGRIEQVGSPLELYNTPANRFVAGFIGCPRMNLVPAAAAVRRRRPAAAARRRTPSASGPSTPASPPTARCGCGSPRSSSSAAAACCTAASPTTCRSRSCSRGRPRSGAATPSASRCPPSACTASTARGLPSLTGGRDARPRPRQPSRLRSARRAFRRSPTASCGCASSSTRCVRVTWRPGAGYREPRTWAIAPGADVPWEGRARDDESGFACPAVAVERSGDGVRVTTAALRIDVRRAAAVPRLVRRRTAARSPPTVPRRRTSAASAPARSATTSPATAASATTASATRPGRSTSHGRRLRTLALDSLGYDPAHGDPLYKHWPFVLDPHRRRRLVRHLLRHAGRVHVRLRLRARQLPRSLPLRGDRRRRPRLLPHRRRDAGRGDRALRAPDRRHAPAAALDAGLRADRDGADRRAGRAGAAVRVHRPLRRGARADLGVPLRLRLLVARPAALRVHLEPRQVPRSPRPDGQVPRSTACASSPTSSPACSTTTRRTRRCAPSTASSTTPPPASRRRPVLGRRRRLPRLHHARRRSRWWQRGPRRRSARLRHRRRLERQQRVRRDGRRRALRTASARRCRCTARARCRRC